MNIKIGFVLLLSAVCQAAPFTNGGFEIGVNPGAFLEQPSGATGITGWTVGLGGVDYIGSYWNPHSGSRSVDLSRRNAGSLSQSFDTIIGQAYLVNFWMAGNPVGGPPVKILRATAAGNTAHYTFSTSSRTPAAMGWVEEEFLFTAVATTTTLTFTSLNNTGYGPALDDISVSQAVPEPAAWIMLVTGLGAILLSRHAIRRTR